MAAIALFLALLLGASALHKVVARERLGPVVARLAGVSLPLGAVLLALTATIEALGALAMSFATLQPFAAFGAAGLWGVYALALVRHRGKVLDCGCDFVARERPVDAFAMLRPALLASLALLVGSAGAPSFTLETPFAAAALAALWFAAGELHAIPPIRSAHR
jgi:hypothetical protein